MKYLDLAIANETIKTTDIKGKEYAEVNQRIKAFRMVYPQGMIETQMLSCENGVCVFKANVYEPTGVLLGTGHAYEKENSTFINKTSYIENCETSAVGRALGMAGFGIDVSVASAEEVANAIQNQEVTQEEADLASSIPVESLLRSSNPESGANPYQSFIDIVLDEVEEKTNKSPYTTGMKIYTTLDTGKQNVLNDIMSGATWEWKDEYIQAGVGVISTQTGEILAIGGGRNRNGERMFNYATMINKQIGSTAKPNSEKTPVDGQAYYYYDSVNDKYIYCVIQPQQTTGLYVIDDTAAKVACGASDKAVNGMTYFDKYTKNNGVYYAKVIKVQ